MKKLLFIFLTLFSLSVHSQQVEKLSRGVVTVKTDDSVFISWRLLATDPSDVAFNVYRDEVKLNKTPLTKVTNFTDPHGTSQSHYIVEALNVQKTAEKSTSLFGVLDGCLRIHLDCPPNGIAADGREYSYSANDCSVADVDADGNYEIIVKWEPSLSHDNSHSGHTGQVIFDCYTFTGEKLWRINLGSNIRAGAHYTQFLAFDFDSDGRAEFACKTAPGSIDGTGHYVSDATDDEAIRDVDNTQLFANANGHILSGDEYLTIFDGQTGKAISTVRYVPGRDIRSLDKDGWGDGYGNRSERYLATVAFLPNDKGIPTPSLVMCRGYYTYAFICAWQFDGHKLTKRWFYETPSADWREGLYGAGAHSVLAADVDADGFDEIVYGAASLDHNGTLLYNTGWGHGDALHLSDMDPDSPGLEIFMPHEAPHHAGCTPDDEPMDYGVELRQANTGKILWCRPSSFDNGRGLAADIDSTHRGYEMWSLESKNVYDIKGNVINDGVGQLPPVNFRIYWDGDLQDELFDGGDLPWRRAPQRANNKNDKNDRRFFKKDGQPQDPQQFLEGNRRIGKSYIYKWDVDQKRANVFAELDGATCNGTKRNPNFLGDIFGDWREEVVLSQGNDLVIYTTTIPTPYRVVTLPHDHAYRMCMTTQNSAYNQPPHIGYYLPALFGKK